MLALKGTVIIFTRGFQGFAVPNIFGPTHFYMGQTWVTNGPQSFQSSTPVHIEKHVQTWDIP
jgi:hypothetical protein